jgi:hypothetical protein
VAVLMTTRLLPGAQRISPGKWQWGCWEITRDPEANFWMAVDVVTDFKESTYAIVMSRVEIDGPCLEDMRWFMWELAHKGPHPLTDEEVDALRRLEAV